MEGGVGGTGCPRTGSSASSSSTDQPATLNFQGPSKPSSVTSAWQRREGYGPKDEMESLSKTRSRYIRVGRATSFVERVGEEVFVSFA